jgi:predicted secreted hydrolase
VLRAKNLLWFLGALLFAGACSMDAPEENPPVSLESALDGEVDSGFLRAVEPREFKFPGDHGAHDGYRNEWWYITGNLETEQGEAFGYQVTFFRIALTSDTAEKRLSRWAASHVWMAHVALTDPEKGQHIAYEKLAREAMGLAGVQPDPFKIWVGDWQLYSPTNSFPWQIKIAGEDFELDLKIDALRRPLLHGDRGLSQKSEKAGNASFYYSITRLKTGGTIKIGANQFSVTGLSWLDREWSSSILGENQIGWDWFSLQLDEDTDLMFYNLRNRDGKSDPHSAGSILTSDNRQILLDHTDLDLTPTRWWKNPKGVNYPVTWELYIKPLQRKIVVESVLNNQEMNLSVNYWEGMVTVTEHDKQIGKGYLELTGY